ncbi:MAG: hypothetical protein Q7S99_05390 [Parvibaculum sp.]|nr:hypothetical protein [Parvibaculum sp.]
MKHYYSATTGGFYNDDIHGARTLLVADPDWVRSDPLLSVFVADPDWVRPRKLVADPDWVCPRISVPDPDDAEKLIEVDDPDAFRAMIEVDDVDAVAPEIEVESDDPGESAPMIEISNPECKIPGDAVEVSDSEYQNLFDAQSAGKIIVAGKKGRPCAVNRPAPTEAEAAARLAKMARKELSDSDWRVLRAAEVGVPVSPEWLEYRAALRLVASGEAMEMPVVPK